ncbi:hypothetical protein Cfor_10575, partial [Coptotermes formosanus]
GDSGGPLKMTTTETKAYSIVGVTSFRQSVCMDSTPGIYTRVNKYVDWIDSIIRNKQLVICSHSTTLSVRKYLN